jgi:hypothetical protein
MQRIEQPAADLRASTQRRTLRLAWLTLSGFLLFFILLLAWAGLSIYTFYVEATSPREATVVVRGELDRLSWQPAGRSAFQGVRDGQPLGEGDAVRALSTAGYGQVASIRLFDESQLDLWAGTQVRLRSLRTSRWNERVQEVVVAQDDGYVRYDIKAGQPFQAVSFRVQIGLATVELAPGGSYSVELRASERVIDSVGAVLPAQIADVAVRSGSAVVVGANGDRVELGERQRVEVDPAGVPSLAVPARWDLVRDGGFTLFSELEYNNTTLNDEPGRAESRFWTIEATPTLPPEQRGYFRVAQICRPPLISRCEPNEQRSAAWFYRAGEQTNSFTIFATQRLGPEGAGVDISEYRTLTFSLWARVLEQSLRDAGDRGSECPVMVRIVGRRSSPSDPDVERVVCIYVDDGDGEPRAREDTISYHPVRLAEWYELRIDLRSQDWIPDFRYLSRIQIFAQGHDYDSRVAEVSLVGEQ